MKVSVVAYEQPDPDGTAAGRALWTWCEGVLALGHELDAWSWYPEAPRRALPDWCRWRPLDAVPMARAHLRGLVTARMESSRAGWRPAPDAVAVADDVPSFAAVAGLERSAVTVHYRAALDGLALGRANLPALQTHRAERRAGRRAPLVLAFSDRVAGHLRRGGKPTQVVPIAYPVPPQPLPLVEEPVAALIADWSWLPNHRALAWLLSAWPAVREATPGARLLVAGRHLDRARIGTLAGVEVLGEVASGSDVLARAAVVAFPCPATSGPKVKVLEALAHGVPVVTTPAGVEGLVLRRGQGAEVAPRHDYAASLARTLRSPEYRRELAVAGYHAVCAHHRALPVARARLAALEAAFSPEVAPAR
ncbi:MAG TPA: glycosyltransferase [Acidimicrobiales bacterium]|nr:glycosyltransferase [Acidimicrobiales bacterium]